MDFTVQVTFFAVRDANQVGFVNTFFPWGDQSVKSTIIESCIRIVNIFVFRTPCPLSTEKFNCLPNDFLNCNLLQRGSKSGSFTKICLPYAFVLDRVKGYSLRKFLRCPRNIEGNLYLFDTHCLYQSLYAYTH